MDNPKIASLNNINDLLLQIMETLTTLNKEHQNILTQFEKRIDRFIYDVTDYGCDYEKFKNFIPLKSRVTKLHNVLGHELTSDVSRTEWIFMLPNLLLFSAVGFSTALKTKENKNEIDEMCNDLFMYMTETIRDLNDVLDDYELNKNATEAIDIIKQTKNNNKHD